MGWRGRRRGRSGSAPRRLGRCRRPRSSMGRRLRRRGPRRAQGQNSSQQIDNQRGQMPPPRKNVPMQNLPFSGVPYLIDETEA
ncbi:MAG: hypothetical protein CO108_01105 [Deltaproteobacteria bacterium CG_4_9_14_3_um_filter_63_12]|nr:MAG: hypothetical protein CO108_01105 [Deltaproteobacteria bacterium CG_4_9_14_3_um_filter_63_12]